MLLNRGERLVVFNAQCNVGFSNFIPRVQEMHNLLHMASVGFSDLRGFSRQYYVMDIKSETS